MFKNSTAAKVADRPAQNACGSATFDDDAV